MIPAEDFQAPASLKFCFSTSFRMILHHVLIDLRRFKATHEDSLNFILSKALKGTRLLAPTLELQIESLFEA